MNGDCGCLPGTEADGWQEVRSEECRRDELAAWPDMAEWLARLAQDPRWLR